MVKPGGTGRPRLLISARLAPLPPSSARIPALPSAVPLPKEYTQRAMCRPELLFFETVTGAVAALCGNASDQLLRRRLVCEHRVMHDFPRPNVQRGGTSAIDL